MQQATSRLLAQQMGRAIIGWLVWGNIEMKWF
jgi:hypothetical protein